MALTLDPYVADTLMPDLVGHDRMPSAFLVFLFLWRHGAHRAGGAAFSLRQIAEGTGLSKRGVQLAITLLRRRRLLSIERDSPTDVPAYRLHRTWRRRLSPAPR